MNKLLIICGPTATGKTKFGIRLAHHLHGELISADSRQVYTYMDIGTGKDLPKHNTSYESRVTFGNQTYVLPVYIIQGISLWMYDVIRPDEEFSISHYKKIATHIISDIQNRKKLPILVGGTGLYIKSVTDPIDTITIPKDYELRKKLDAKSVTDLQYLLQSYDSRVWDTMNHSDRNNKRRLQRKIEIALSKQKPDDPRHHILPRDVMKIGLTAPKHILERNIQMRVQKRLKQGIIKEIRSLQKMGYSWGLPSMTALGYREWQRYNEWDHGSQALSENQIVDLWTRHEIQYAKKQLTWFKRDRAIIWFDVSKEGYKEEIMHIISKWYN